MADPRKAVDFEGIGGRYESLLADGSTIVFDVTKAGGSAAVGLAVKLSGNSTVALCVDGDRVHGKLVNVESDGVCNVQTGGDTTLPAGNGATVTAGFGFVGALGAASAPGYIRQAAATGAAYAEGAADDTQAARGNVIIDASTATAVKVRIG